MFKIGNNNFVQLIFGEDSVNKIMLGISLIYEKPIAYKDRYLTFDVLTDGTILWKGVGGHSTYSAFTISYSKDNGTTWTDITATSSGAVINVIAGDKVLFKGSNDRYAWDKNAYSGFEGGTATYNIEGNIMSLIYGDNFKEKTSLVLDYVFCSIFKLSNVISAENLILPATTLTQYCYRAMFSKAHSLVKPPQLPATTLSKGCYWYMFEECPITSAPDLLAETLKDESYGHMFEGCSNLSYIRCLAINRGSTGCTTDWVKNVSATGRFVKHPDTTWTSSVSSILSGWEIVDDSIPLDPVIVFDGFDTIELSCSTLGVTIYYRLNETENYHEYTSPIIIGLSITIETYSAINNLESSVVSLYCKYKAYNVYNNANRNIKDWKYNNQNVTVPYSVNAIDGHSGSYARGTFTFETGFSLRLVQPVYLWFLHADQTALIYIDDTLVTKHWGGYNAFFVDISNYVHTGLNNLKVTLKNNEGNILAPYNGDFNFNATLGKVKLFTSPYMPAMNYGYDGFHITSTVSDSEATINVRTTIPVGASVVCSITGTNCNYTETKDSTGDELTFTTIISNPHLWNGTIDPYLYTVSLKIYNNGILYHSYMRSYGLRYYSYVFNEEVNGESYTGFLLNGSPYLLRGVCIHDDLANKANALTDADYTLEFNIIKELGCNFLRLAHYPHPREVYDKCDKLGIIVQTEAPWVNKSTTSETADYWAHLEDLCADMVNQHYNHPCILFWGVGNEINTSYTGTEEGRDFVKAKIEGYRTIIRNLLPGAWVGYTVSHGTDKGLGIFNYPTVDWLGSNIYVGWYVNQNSNNPSSYLNSRIAHTEAQNIPTAYSEYGCGGTSTCHSEDYTNTTTKGNNPRHDIEYQMWLHEGHIAAIKNYPQLLFTSLWMLFDIAVANRNEGYTECLDGENTSTNDDLRHLNNKGLVERDHITKKDTFYLYKAWWNPTPFVHICLKNYTKYEDRVIKCYTNDGNSLTLYVNGDLIETVSVVNNIAEFTALDLYDTNVITVSGATTSETFTFLGGPCPYVEIGGLKWSIKNVGATDIIDPGLFFQWGDTTGYTASLVGTDKLFNWTDYTLGNGGDLDSDMTKYNTNDGLTTLQSSDDVATVIMGSEWRTPTAAEYLALYNASNVNYEIINSKPTFTFTDKLDSSKKLYFPIAGECYDGGIYYPTDLGSYWSSTLDSNTTKAINVMYVTGTTIIDHVNDRCRGSLIRGVVNE